jgi:hypothetical protein
MPSEESSTLPSIVSSIIIVSLNVTAIIASPHVL